MYGSGRTARGSPRSEREPGTKQRLAFALIMAAFLSAGTAVSVRAFEYDENGTEITPMMCPLAFPAPGWPALVARTWYVPRWNLPAGDEVPFFVTSVTWTNKIQPVPVGYGWYKPDQSTKDNYDGNNWSWQGPTGVGGVYIKCDRVRTFFGLFEFWVANYTGAQWGYAVPVGDDGTEGENIVNTGGGEGETCYEAYYWWIDNTGYHETFITSWCEDDGEAQT